MNRGKWKTTSSNSVGTVGTIFRVDYSSGHETISEYSNYPEKGSGKKKNKKKKTL